MMNRALSTLFAAPCALLFLVVVTCGAKAQEPDSPELKVLAKLIGTWDDQYAVEPNDNLPEGQKATAVTRRQWALDGKYVLGQGTWEPAKTAYAHLVTYDGFAGVYRSWYFDASGTMPRAVSTGTWDEKTQMLNWSETHEDGHTMTSYHKFVDDDHQEWALTLKGPDGEIVLSMKGTSTRRKEEPKPDAEK